MIASNRMLSSVCQVGLVKKRRFGVVKRPRGSRPKTGGSPYLLRPAAGWLQAGLDCGGCREPQQTRTTKSDRNYSNLGGGR